MKRIRIGLCLALTIGASAVGYQARGCGVSFHLGLPCLSFGVGLGLGLGAGYSCCSAYDCGWSYPVYGCRQTVFDEPERRVALAPTVVAPAATQASVWVPSTPGVGHWVPDPTPYRYETEASVRKVTAPAVRGTETVTVSKSAGGVPIYRVQFAVGR